MDSADSKKLGPPELKTSSAEKQSLSASAAQKSTSATAVPKKLNTENVGSATGEINKLIFY